MDSPERFTSRLDHDVWQQWETIRHHGWALQAVPGDEDGPPYVYTVGLSGLGHAELILFATPAATAATVLDDLAALVRSGRALHPGEQIGLRSGAVHLLTFPESADWLFAANELYRLPGEPPVPALLVVPAEELAPTPEEDVPRSVCS